MKAKQVAVLLAVSLGVALVAILVLAVATALFVNDPNETTAYVAGLVVGELILRVWPMALIYVLSFGVTLVFYLAYKGIRAISSPKKVG